MARTVKFGWVLAALIGTAAVAFALGYLLGKSRAPKPDEYANSIPVDIAVPTPAITPQTAETIYPTPNEPSPTPKIESTPEKTDITVSPGSNLAIPVVGVKPEQLRDTYNDARSEGRRHDAIDIMAPRGTQVVAAADGEIARFFDSERGGITIYQYSQDKKLIYYYAHLERRADGVKAGDFVKQGTVIGYVGDSGNSGAGNYHLHFAVWTVDDPKRYWEGTNINPYPLLGGK